VENWKFTQIYPIEKNKEKKKRKRRRRRRREKIIL